MKMDNATTTAMEVTPHILKALGASKKLVKPISKALKSVGCKNQRNLLNELKAQNPECAKISEQYVKMLSEVLQARETQAHKDSQKKSGSKTALSLLGTGVKLGIGVMGVGTTWFMHKFTNAFSDAIEKE